MKLIAENIGVLSLVTICGCIGYFLGNPLKGVVTGIAIVATVTLAFVYIDR